MSPATSRIDSTHDAWIFSNRSRRRATFSRTDSTPTPGSVLEEFTGTDAEYDLALCFEVIEHIDDDDAFVRQLASSLRPDGVLIGSVPAYPHKWQAVDEYAGHVRRYGPADMKALLTRSGFEDVSVEVYGFPLTNLLYLPRTLHYGPRAAGRSTEARLAATHDSGISRNLVGRVDKRLVYPVVRAFAAMQHLPAVAGFGDGLLFSATSRRRR